MKALIIVLFSIFPLLAQAACPTSLSGTYGGVALTDDFEGGGKVFTSKNASINVIMFTSTMVKYVGGYAKGAAQIQGFTLDPFTTGYSFNKTTCVGIFGDGVSLNQYIFVVTDSGAEINIMLYKEAPSYSTTGGQTLVWRMRKL